MSLDLKNIFIASAKKHKIEEIKAVLPKEFKLVGLDELNIQTEIPETGQTLRENALLKARFLKDFLKIPNAVIIADDSGLEVEALDGAPGVYSARYAGEPKNDLQNNLKLLNELRLQKSRKARFVTIIALIDGEKELFFEGEVKGTIAYEPKGAAGFGYDPLFIPTGYRSTFAELGLDVKNQMSHRSNAVKELMNYLIK